jgi:hypothetical protein
MLNDIKRFLTNSSNQGNIYLSVVPRDDNMAPVIVPFEFTFITHLVESSQWQQYLIKLHHGLDLCRWGNSIYQLDLARTLAEHAQGQGQVQGHSCAIYR